MQLKAIKQKGNCVAIASAGSGKTSVLVERTARLIDSGINPENILLITFTVKSADEMRKRITKKVGKDLASLLTCGTFHSWLHIILRKYSKLIGLTPKFAINEPRDIQDLLGILRGTFLDNLSSKNLHYIYSSSVNTRADLGDIVKSVLKVPKVEESLIKKMQKLFTQFNDYKKEHAILDFDDLLTFGYQVLIHPDFHIKYEHVLVDEYQDCNSIQVDIVKALYNKGSTIFVVGDVSQSIYSFRGSDYHFLQSFEEDFKAKKVILDTNYRSTDSILKLANAIGKNFKSDFYAMHGVKAGSKPIYVRTNGEDVQFSKIVDMIKESGYSYKDIAVLYRSNATGSSLEKYLSKSYIPYIIKGGPSYFDKSHVRDLMALLHLTFYYHDTISWLRVLTLHKGIGKAGAMDLLNRIYGEEGLDALDSKGLSYLKDTIRNIKASNKNVNSALGYAINFLNVILKNVYKDWENRKSDMTRIYGFASQFKTMKSLITGLSLENPEEESKLGVTLSTVHSAKGLEWKFVIIASVSEERFPSAWFLKGRTPKEQNQIIDEDRRLFYVAVTRAKEKLVICSPMTESEFSSYDNYGIVKQSKESIFIKEIDNFDELVKLDYPFKSFSKEERDSRSFKNIRRDYDNY